VPDLTWTQVAALLGVIATISATILKILNKPNTPSKTKTCDNNGYREKINNLEKMTQDQEQRIRGLEIDFAEVDQKVSNILDDIKQLNLKVDSLLHTILQYFNKKGN